MDIEQLNQWLSALALVISIITALGLWLSRPSKELAGKVTDLKCDFDKFEAGSGESFKQHDRRIQRVEDTVAHLPTKEDIHSVSMQIVELKTELRTVARMVNRVDEHLRESGG